MHPVHSRLEGGELHTLRHLIRHCPGRDGCLTGLRRLTTFTSPLPLDRNSHLNHHPLLPTVFRLRKTHTFNTGVSQPRASKTNLVLDKCTTRSASGCCLQGTCLVKTEIATLVFPPIFSLCSRLILNHDMMIPLEFLLTPAKHQSSCRLSGALTA